MKEEGGRKFDNLEGEKALTNLSLRIDSLRGELGRGGDEGDGEGSGEGGRGMHGGMSGMSLGARVMVELLVAPGVGGVLGYSLDGLWGTLPLFLVLGVVLGGAAGVLNVKRLSDRDDEKREREAYEAGDKEGDKGGDKECGEGRGKEEEWQVR